MENRKKLGNYGENIAAEYLENKGYKILTRNWKNKWGEIDIVAKKKGVIVFCEVKTISEKQDFDPEDEIDWKKQRQLIKMAQIYLSSHKIPLDTAHQIDILAIEINPLDKSYKIRHTENAIEDNY